LRHAAGAAAATVPATRAARRTLCAMAVVPEHERIVEPIVEPVPTRNPRSRTDARAGACSRSRSRTRAASPRVPRRAESPSRHERRRSARTRAEQERLAPYEQIARLIIKRRTELGLTQQELAKRMGTSHTAISRIESGQHPTKPDTPQPAGSRAGSALRDGVRELPRGEAGPRPRHNLCRPELLLHGRCRAIRHAAVGRKHAPRSPRGALCVQRTHREAECALSVRCLCVRRCGQRACKPGCSAEPFTPAARVRIPLGIPAREGRRRCVTRETQPPS
jgi:DNA-binding XRE family transcriptional regulator